MIVDLAVPFKRVRRVPTRDLLDSALLPPFRFAASAVLRCRLWPVCGAGVGGSDDVPRAVPRVPDSPDWSPDSIRFPTAVRALASVRPWFRGSPGGGFQFPPSALPSFLPGGFLRDGGVSFPRAARGRVAFAGAALGGCQTVGSCFSRRPSAPLFARSAVPLSATNRTRLRGCALFRPLVILRISASVPLMAVPDLLAFVNVPGLRPLPRVGRASLPCRRRTSTAVESPRPISQLRSVPQPPLSPRILRMPACFRTVVSFRPPRLLRGFRQRIPGWDRRRSIRPALSGSPRFRFSPRGVRISSGSLPNA